MKVKISFSTREVSAAEKVAQAIAKMLYCCKQKKTPPATAEAYGHIWLSGNTVAESPCNSAQKMVEYR